LSLDVTGPKAEFVDRWPGEIFSVWDFSNYSVGFLPKVGGWSVPPVILERFERRVAVWWRGRLGGSVVWDWRGSGKL
jgi:hypothetical protein